MKLKMHFGKGELMSLLSTLTVVLGFSVAVLCCVFVLSKAGIIRFSGTADTEATSSAPEEFSQTGQSAPARFEEIVTDGITLSQGLLKMPYSDSYKAMFSVRYFSESGSSLESIVKNYNVIYCGDKFKIVISNWENTAELTVMGKDGKIYVTDNNNYEMAVFDESDTASFLSYAALPDFSFMDDESYKITGVSEGESEYTVFGESDSFNIQNEFRINKETGMLSYATSYLGNHPLLMYSLEYFNPDYIYSTKDFP